tara:strand:- start:4247 stop:4777 length:531 start_codon:yes stop_codon:yes gene_type:complete
MAAGDEERLSAVRQGQREAKKKQKAEQRGSALTTKAVKAKTAQKIAARRGQPIKATKKKAKAIRLATRARQKKDLTKGKRTVVQDEGHEADVTKTAQRGERKVARKRTRAMVLKAKAAQTKSPTRYVKLKGRTERKEIEAKTARKKTDIKMEKEAKRKIRRSKRRTYARYGTTKKP